MALKLVNILFFIVTGTSSYFSRKVLIAVGVFFIACILGAVFIKWSALADGPFLLDSWCETSSESLFSCSPTKDSFSLNIGYAWDLPHRRDGRPETNGWYDSYVYNPTSGTKYVDIPEVIAVDMFVWGIKESMKKMGLPEKITSEHGSAYVQLYNVSTSDPQYSNNTFSHEYPPHFNLITYGTKPWSDETNAHFYTKSDGTLRTDLISYAPSSRCGYTFLRHNNAINVWQPHYDPSCKLIHEQRVTGSGQLELRVASGSPVYTLTNKGINNMDIHRNGLNIMNIKRTVHDARYTTAGAFIDATVVFEIRDFERSILTKQTMVTQDDTTGAFSSHTVVEQPLSGDLPTATPISAPTNTPTPIKSSLVPGDVNGDGTVNITDLSILLSNYGKQGANPEQGDLNGDGLVNITDLSILLSNFGKTDLTVSPTPAATPTFTPLPSPTSVASPTPGGQISCNYYVAPNGSSSIGTMSNPWSLSRANTSAQVGDTVCLMAGTYLKQRLDPQNSGTSSSPIVFTARPGDEHKVVIDGGDIVYNSAEGSRGWANITNVSNITVSKLRIINAGYYGVYLDNADNITISDNQIDHTFSSAVHVGNSRNVIIEHNYIEHATHGMARAYQEGDTDIDNCATNGSHCTPHEWISLRGGTDGFEVRYNTLDNRDIEGYVTKVRGDKVWARSKEGIDAKESVRNGKIYGNFIHSLARNSIYVDAYATYAENIQIYNNEVVNGRNSGIAITSEQRGTVDSVWVYNNIIRDGDHNGIWVSALDQGGPTKNIIVSYNTVYGNTEVGIAVTNQESSNVRLENNISYKNSNKQISIQVSGASETNNLTSDPRFVNEGSRDFHLRSDSSAIGKGNSTGRPNFDFDNNPRPVGSGYDLGAYERQ